MCRTIDKGKIKEEIEFQKAERDAAINRMRSMDAKIRLAEQLIRDPTIDKTTADVEDEMHELEDLRIHIADLENELQIKKNCIEEYERDLADSKTLRETAGLKIEQLKKNVDDLVGHKRDLGTQLREAKLEVDHLTDLLASLKEELDAFKTGAKAERDKANEAERVSRRKVVGGSTNNADMIVDLEESLAEMQAKANVQEKLLKDLRKEKDYLIIANEAGLRESKLLVEALKNVAVSAKLIASNIEGQYPDLAEQLEKTRNFLSEIKSIGVNVSGAYNQASVRRDQTQKLLDEYRVEPEHVLTKRLRMLEEKDEKIRELEQELATLHDASSSTSKPASKVPSSKVAKVVHDNKKEKELERDLVIAKQTIKKLENEVVEAKMAAKIPKRKSMKPLATEDANGLTPRNKAPEVTEKLVYSRRNSNVELSSGTVASMIPTGSTDKHEDGKANEDEEDVALDELRGELQQLTLSNMRLERELEEMQAKSSEAERSLASTTEFADEKEKENEQLHAQLRKLQKKLAELSSPKALVSPKEQVESANSMAKFSTATKLSSIDENDKQDQYAKTLTSPSRIDPVVSSIGRENRLTVDTRFNDDLADNIIAGVLGTPLKMDGATNTSIPGTPITPAFRAINSMRRLSTFRAINPNASTDIRNSFMSQRSVDTADREKIQISMETLQEILKSVKEENGYLDTGSEADDATSRDLLQIIYNTCQASCDLAHFAATSKADEDVALKKYVEAVVKNHATELLVMADRAKDGAHDKLAADYDAQLKAKVEEVATSLKKMHEEQAESRIQAYQDDISFLKGEVSILLGRLSALDENGKIIDKTQRKIPHHDKRYSKNRRASNDSHVASLSDSMSASVDITSNMSAVESYIPPNSRHSIRDSIPEHSSTAKTSAIEQRIAEPDTKLPREGKPSNQTSSNYSDLDLESLEERSVNEIPQDSLTFSGKQSKRKNLVIPKVEIDFIPPEGELSPLKVGEDVGNGRIRTFSSGCKDEEDGKTVASAESSKSRKKSALKSSKYPAHEKPSSSSTPINIADDELSIGSRGSNGSNTSLSSARKKPNLEASSASTKGIAMTESPQNQYYSPVNAHEDSNVLSKHELAHLERVEFDKNLELMKDEILEPITLSQVRARMLDNSAGALGNVTADSFDRLRSKNFGSDDLVALTITEHHLRHSSNNNNRPQDQNFRTQLRALTIQRDILRKKVLLSTGLLGLLEYQHTTEKYIALLSSMSVWQKISHFASGGQFLDILYLHRDVICECIDAGGGWMNALPLVNTLSDIKIETTQWPEFFRVRALEILRKRLLKDNKSLVEELEDAQDILIEAQEAVKDARLEASQLRAQLQQAESMNNTTNMFFNPNFRMPSSPGHSPGSKDSADKKFFPSSGAPATLPPLQIPQFPTAIPHELSKAAVSPFPDFLSYSGPTAENLRSFLSFPTYEQLAEKASEQKQSASTELIDTAEILKSAVASPKQIALLNEIKDGRFDENSSAPTEPIAPTVVAPIFDIEPMVVSTAGDSKSSPVASPKAVSPFTVEKELKLLQAVSPASQLRYHLEKQQQAQLQQMNLIQQQQLNQLQEMQKFQLKQLEELRQQRHFKQQEINLQELPKADTKDLFDSSSRIASIDHPIESVNNCEVFDNTGNSVSCIDKEPVESKESPLLIQSPQSNEDEKIEQEMQLAQQQILLMQIQEMQGLRQQQMQQLEVLKFHQEQQLKQFQQAADMEAAYRQQMEEKGRKAENFNPLLQRQQSVRGDVKSPAVHGTDYHRDVRHDVAPNPFVRRKDSLPGTLVRQSSQISELGMESTDANESVGSRGEKFPPQPLTRQHSMSHNAKQTHINANNVNDPFIRKPTANKLKKQPSLARMLGALEHSSDNQNKEVEDPDQRRQEHEMRMIQQQYRDLQFNFMQLQQQLLAQERQHQQEQFKWFMEQQQLLQVNSPVAASAKATGAIRLETKGNDIPISESKQKSSDLDDVNNSIPMDTGHKASESAKKREEDVELPRQNTGVAIAENMMMGVADTLGVPPSSQLSFSNLPQPNQSEDAQNIPSPSPVYSDQLQKLNFFSPQFAAYPPNMFQQMYNPSQIDQAGNTSSTGTGPGQQMMSFPPSMFQQMYNPSQIGQQPSNHIVKIPQAGPNRITSMLQQMYKPSPMNQQVRNYGAEGPDITSSDYIANELRQRAFQRKQLRNASMGISSFSSDTNSQGAKPRTSRIWSKVYDSIRGSEKSSASADNLEPPKNEFRLHAAADRLCIRALNGDNRAARIMRSIIDGVELWSKGESKAGFVTNFHEIDIDARSVDTEDSDSRLSIQALLNDLLKLSEMETVPLEVGEVNQKLIKILDYCEENNIRHATTRDEEEQMVSGQIFTVIEIEPVKYLYFLLEI